MKLIEDVKILLVGLGQLGGGYAQALSSVGFDVGAIDINPESISYALENGIISSGRSSNDPEYISSFGLIISALYPHIFIDWVKENGKYLAPGTLLTDVTGVKSCVVYDAQNALRPDVEYIPAHPMAGREVYGVQNADSSIFRGANFIVAPTEKNTEKGIEWCKSLGKILGFGKISVL
ncbi:MAG: prephenate dehydrogenase/arogenate dehydrogenase family protein, partial [Oscillospiraceae bacterium]|nr:prephenate dehydrogenase/arogenate dehydrogenase family protein [Oscillospiraceae bacterium]